MLTIPTTSCATAEEGKEKLVKTLSKGGNEALNFEESIVRFSTSLVGDPESERGRRPKGGGDRGQRVLPFSGTLKELAETTTT